MERVEVDLLTEQTNYAILRLPQRRFPGVLFQGDSLHILHTDAERALETLDRDPSEGREELVALVDHLGSLVEYYIETLHRHGLALPFFPNSE